MKRNRTKPFAVNTIIMANLAFLALLFFQFALPPEYDEGIKKTLPKKFDVSWGCGLVIPDRDILRVQVNQKGQILLEDQLSSVSQLYGVAKKFYRNSENNVKYPDFHVRTLKEALSQVQSWQEVYDAAKVNSPEQIAAAYKLQDWKGRLTTLEAIEEPFYQEISKLAVIVIDIDEEASFGRYIEVMSELRAAMNDLRNEYALQYFGQSYSDLDPVDDRDKLIAIRHLVPYRIVKTESYY